MKLVELNLLLYAVNTDAPQHDRAHRWWETTLAEDEGVGIAWVVVLGFLRLTTRPGLFPRPLTPKQALDVIEEWIHHPSIVLVHPGPRHWEVLRGLLDSAGMAGNLTTDAHLAALAIEHGFTLCSTDGDFARFRELQWENPLTPNPT